jgi:PKHD-type hydroxylase
VTAPELAPPRQHVPLINGFAVSFPPGAGGLPPELVTELRTAFDDEKMVEARIGHGPQERNLDRQIRDAQVQWIPRSAVSPAIYSHLFTLALVTNEEQGWRFELDGIAQFLQATRYDAGGQHYDWHLDWGGGRTQFRKIAAVVHLSEPTEFTGGALQVAWGRRPYETTPVAGTVTVFPAFMMHRVTPVTAGTRSSVVSWMLGPSFR